MFSILNFYLLDLWVPIFPSLERSPGRKTMTPNLSYPMSLIALSAFLSRAIIYSFQKTASPQKEILF